MTKYLKKNIRFFVPDWNCRTKEKFLWRIFISRKTTKILSKNLFFSSRENQEILGGGVERFFHRVGTKLYMAPELLEPKSKFEFDRIVAYQQADIYSLSLVFWEICHSFQCKNHQRPYENQLPDSFSVEQLTDLICQEKKRPTFDEFSVSSDRVKTERRKRIFFFSFLFFTRSKFDGGEICFFFSSSFQSSIYSNFIGATILELDTQLRIYKKNFEKFVPLNGINEFSQDDQFDDFISMKMFSFAFLLTNLFDSSVVSTCFDKKFSKYFFSSSFEEQKMFFSENFDEIDKYLVDPSVTVSQMISQVNETRLRSRQAKKMFVDGFHSSVQHRFQTKRRKTRQKKSLLRRLWRQSLRL